jgi:5-methylcytosine-specific restriction endonuclease McrA
MTENSKKYRNADWIREKYWEEELNLKEIGDIAGVSGDTILRWMKKHDIDRRPTGGEVSPSRDEYIDALQRVADRLGRSPTLEEYKQVSRKDEPNVGAYKGLFDSWNTAKEAAGLSPCSSGPDGPSKEECVRALRKVANQLGKSPSQREYDNTISEGEISAANIKHQFSSWNAAKEAAGLEVVEKHGWTKSEVINSISRVSEQHDGQLSKRVYLKLKQPTDPSVDTIMRLFGSWNQALDSAGLLPQPSQYTEEECIEALQYVAEKIGRSPRIREYRRHRRPTDPVPWVMKNSFESWNDMKELADLYAYDDGSYLEFPYGSNWRNIAEQARERDNYKCRSCGLTSEEHTDIYDRDLEVHHLHKIMSFFEILPDKLKDDIRSEESLSESDRKAVERILDKANDLTNLVTVCKKCHSQLEPLPVEKQTELVDAALPEVHA